MREEKKWQTQKETQFDEQLLCIRQHTWPLMLSCLILVLIQRGRHDYPHFRDEKPEAQVKSVTSEDHSVSYWSGVVKRAVSDSGAGLTSQLEDSSS